MIKIVPVEKNKEYTIEIESLSSEGSGIGHIDGFAVFVANAAVGDKVRIKIVKVKSGYAYGIILDFIEKSKDRIEPVCPYYKRCGGCQLLHINYAAELELKKSIIENALKRIGGFDDINVSEIIGCESRERYRNKMIFPVGEKDGAIQAGFYSPRSHDIVDIEDCLLGDELCSDIIKAVREYMTECGVRAYDEKVHKGKIRRIFVRKGYNIDEVMVVVSANANNLKNSEGLIDKLRNISDRIKSIILNVNTKKTNLVLGDRNVLLWGKDRISDILCGLKYEISPHSFFQVNPIQTEKLYNKAIEFAGLTGNETVLDVYCGIGTISLCAARKADRVIGVEIVPQAIEDAKENAKRNGISNAEFYADSAENTVPKLIAGGVKPDVVILDPPRKGSDVSTLSAIAKAEPDRIVYVSCNPATLARDMKFLGENGYKADKVVGVDMFAGTVHVETVVLLSHKKPDGHINVKVEFGEGEGKVPLDDIAQRAESYKPKERVTYKMIKEYIEAKYGFKVHTAYIAEVKRDLGLPMYDAPNAVEELKQPRKHPTAEKVEAIKDALKHFEVI